MPLEMDSVLTCGCKGCRVCLLCEKTYGKNKEDFCAKFKNFQNCFVFCPECSKLYKEWNVKTVVNEHPHHSGKLGIDFPGVYVQCDFITKDEETVLMKGIDEMPWVISQSGRRKQNFGPKTNFKKMKLATGNFTGFPEFSKFLQTNFKTIPLLSNFQTIEQCSLEYDPIMGASIDPHIDDCWIWGERVVTVNCLSDSVLTLSKYKGDSIRYNLSSVESYRSKLLSVFPESNAIDDLDDVVIRIPMPNRSIIILYGKPRYEWEHCVLREDITKRRVCIAYREFTPPYLLNGDHYEKGKAILDVSKVFWDHSVC